MKLGTILFFPLQLLNQVLGILCGEASWFFNAREIRIIEAALAA